MRKSKSDFAANGLYFTREQNKKNNVRLKTTLPAIMGAFCEGESLLKNPHNLRMFCKSPFSPETGFRGGSVEGIKNALTGQRDISGVMRAKEKLQGTLVKGFETGFTNTPKRRRYLSEHDGDWDFDRRWDIAPFSSSKKDHVPVRTLKIIAHFYANATTAAKELDQYGAFLVALIELIEARGVTVDLTWRAVAKDFTNHTNQEDCTIDVHLKKPGEYISTQVLATAFWSNFFRRVGFFGIIACAEFAGKDVSTGFGRSAPRQAVKVSPGVLEVSPNAGHIANSQEVIEAIKQALA